MGKDITKCPNASLFVPKDILNFGHILGDFGRLGPFVGLFFLPSLGCVLHFFANSFQKLLLKLLAKVLLAGSVIGFLNGHKVPDAFRIPPPKPGLASVRNAPLGRKTIFLKDNYAIVVRGFGLGIPSLGPNYREFGGGKGAIQMT